MEVEGSFRELDEVFAIVAKAPEPVPLAGPFDVGPMNQMVQSLLAERFKLRVRWETRSFPV
jgi:bla regulator protein blaR1